MSKVTKTAAAFSALILAGTAGEADAQLARARNNDNYAIAQQPNTINAEHCVARSVSGGTSLAMQQALVQINDSNSMDLKITCDRTLLNGYEQGTKTFRSTMTSGTLTTALYNSLSITPEDSTPSSSYSRPARPSAAEVERQQCEAAMRNAYVSGSGAVVSIGQWTKTGNGACYRNR